MLSFVAAGLAGAVAAPSTARPLAATKAARGKANLWVDHDGGRCRRSPARRGYADAAACTWNAAYGAARSGDLVLVAGGSYGSVAIGPDNRALKGPVTIQAAPGATVTLDNLNTNGDWLTLRNLTVATADVHARGWFNRASHVTLASVDVTGPWANVRISGSDVIWRDSRLGTPGNTRIRLCGKGDGEPVELANVRNLLFSNLDFYPFQPELGNPACGPDGNMHLETIRVWDAVDGWRLERSRFHRGDGSGSARVFFSKIEGPGPRRITFVNNWFGSSSGSVSIYLTRNSPCDDYTFAYNHWEQSFVDECSPKTSLRMIANTGTEPDYLPCMGTVNVRNLWVWSRAGSCGTDRWVTSSGKDLGALRYAPDGYHLRRGSPAIDAGDAAECMALTRGVDIDGKRRKGRCDAGPDEYGN